MAGLSRSISARGPLNKPLKTAPSLSTTPPDRCALPRPRLIVAFLPVDALSAHQDGPANDWGRVAQSAVVWHRPPVDRPKLSHCGCSGWSTDSHYRPPAATDRPAD